MSEIIITNDLTIEQIQDKFNAHFPFLKIEFFKTSHEEGEGSPKDNIIQGNHIIGDIRSNNSSGELSIHGNQKVSTLEEAFKEDYGLNVQVFRKSGKVWLETTNTDEWTLAEQNKTGEDMNTYLETT